MKSYLTLFLFLFKGYLTNLTFPQYYHHEMVFQSFPTNPKFWGFFSNNSSDIYVNQFCDSYVEDHKVIFESSNIWSVNLTGLANGAKCRINVTQELSVLTLNIIFGDVYICAGQSNMEWTMNQIFNSSDEIKQSAEFYNIKMYQLNHGASSLEEEDLIYGGWNGWYDPKNSTQLGSFSAVCFLYARELSKVLGNDYVFGLIDSSWSGTRIEAWSSYDVLYQCNVPYNADEEHIENSNSHLWNAMIHPLLRHSIFGVIWYQGEANSNWNPDLYACTFVSLISDWRSKWNKADPDFPFGFVQLANNVHSRVTDIRWHQTNNVGYVPNSNSMVKTFMAVGMDTYDKESGIHPRNKQIIAKRLCIAGANVAYGMTQYPTNGPFPQNISLDNSIIIIEYDQAITYRPEHLSGFYTCSSSYEQCDSCSLSFAQSFFYTLFAFTIPFALSIFLSFLLTKFTSLTVIPNLSLSLTTFLAFSSTFWLIYFLILETQNCWISLDQSKVKFHSNKNKIIIDLDNSKISAFAYLWEDTPTKVPMGLPIYANDSFQLPAAPWKIKLY